LSIDKRLRAKIPSLQLLEAFFELTLACAQEMSRELSETHEKHRISVAEIAKKEEQLVVLKVRSQVRRGGGQLVAVYFYKVF